MSQLHQTTEKVKVVPNPANGQPAEKTNGVRDGDGMSTMPNGDTSTEVALHKRTNSMHDNAY